MVGIDNISNKAYTGHILIRYFEKYVLVLGLRPLSSDMRVRGDGLKIRVHKHTASSGLWGEILYFRIVSDAFSGICST